MRFFSKHASVIAYAGLMLAIALFDSMTGIYFSAWVLYFVPVGLATWNLGVRKGLAFAGLAIVLVVCVALLGHPFPSALYLMASLASKAIAYGVLVLLVGALRKKEVGRIYLPRHRRASTDGDFVSTGFTG